MQANTSENVVELFPGKTKWNMIEKQKERKNSQGDECELVEDTVIGDVGFILDNIIENLIEMGYNIDPEDKNFYLLGETLHSFIAKKYEVSHPLQLFADKAFYKDPDVSGNQYLFNPPIIKLNEKQ